MINRGRKIKVLDLFAGAGGFGLGFRLASDKYKIICSLEVDKWAVDTLKANNTEKQKIIQDDIKEDEEQVDDTKVSEVVRMCQVARARARSRFFVDSIYRKTYNNNNNKNTSLFLII